MTGSLTAFLFLSAFTLPAFAIALFWARVSHSGKVRLYLKRSAVAWASMLAVVYAFVAAPFSLCESGNALYGYGSCRVISENAANMSLMAYLIATALAVLYTIILFISCAIAELRARKSRAADHSAD